MFQLAAAHCIEDLEKGRVRAEITYISDVETDSELVTLHVERIPVEEM